MVFKFFPCILPLIKACATYNRICLFLYSLRKSIKIEDWNKKFHVILFFHYFNILLFEWVFLHILIIWFWFHAFHNCFNKFIHIVLHNLPTSRCHDHVRILLSFIQRDIYVHFLFIKRPSTKQNIGKDCHCRLLKETLWYLRTLTKCYTYLEQISAKFIKIIAFFMKKSTYSLNTSFFKSIFYIEEKETIRQIKWTDLFHKINLFIS